MRQILTKINFSYTNHGRLFLKGSCFSDIDIIDADHIIFDTEEILEFEYVAQHVGSCFFP